MNLKEEKIKICNKCGSYLKKINSLTELSAFPSEWYKRKDYLDFHNIYFCNECRLIYSEKDNIKLLKHQLRKIWKLLTTPIEI